MPSSLLESGANGVAPHMRGRTPLLTPAKLDNVAAMNTLRAGLLHLEPQLASHAAEMFAVLSDPAIYEFENEPPKSFEALHERFVKLESRTSSDGSEKWLNWVVKLPSEDLAGYVQATVLVSGQAYVAYEFASRFWRQGIASASLGAVLDLDIWKFWMNAGSLKACNRKLVCPCLT